MVTVVFQRTLAQVFTVNSVSADLVYYRHKCVPTYYSVSFCLLLYSTQFLDPNLTQYCNPLLYDVMI